MSHTKEIKSNKKGNGESYCLVGRISVWEEEKPLATESGDGYRTMWIHLVSLNSALKVVKVVNLSYVHFITVITTKYF